MSVIDEADRLARPGRIGPVPTSLVGIVIVLDSLAINLLYLGRQPLWNDEAFSYFVSRDGLAQSLFWIQKDNQPPLYYLCLSLWQRFGSSEFALRSLSAIAIALASGLVFMTARQIYGRRAGLYASLLFVLSPLLVNWSQKARPYGLQTMFCALAVWGVARVTSSEAARTRWIGTSTFTAERKNSGDLNPDIGWAAYAVGAACALLTQHTAGFFILALNIAATLWMVIGGTAWRRWYINWIAAQLVMVLIWALWLPGFIEQVARLTHIDAGNSPQFFISPTQFWKDTLDVFSTYSLWRAQPVAAALYLAVALYGVRSLPWRTPWPVFLACAIVLPYLICAGGFFLVHPVFGYILATFVWIEIPLIIFIGASIASLRHPLVRMTVLLGFAAFNIWGLYNYYQTSHPAADQVAAELRARAQPGDAIVLSRYADAVSALGYYLRSDPVELAGLDLSRDREGLIRSSDDLKPYKRVWVVVPAEAQPAIDPSQANLGFHLISEQAIGGYWLRCYESGA